MYVYVLVDVAQAFSNLRLKKARNPKALQPVDRPESSEHIDGISVWRCGVINQIIRAITRTIN